MNPRVTNAATQIENMLRKKGLLRVGAPHESVIAAVEEVLQPILCPDTCTSCGCPLCPRCGDHMEPSMEFPRTEFEGYSFCPECSIYVKPDKTEIPVPENAGFKDRRYEMENAMEAPKKEWQN
jgi:hypothetical protein